MTAPLGYFQKALTVDSLIAPNYGLAKVLNQVIEKRKKDLTHCINTVAPPPIVDHRLLRHMVYLAQKYPIRIIKQKDHNQ